MKGLVGGAARGSNCRKIWTIAVMTAALPGGKPKQHNLLGGGRHVKFAPMSAPRPTGDRQEYLDAIVSFAGAGPATESLSQL